MVGTMSDFSKFSRSEFRQHIQALNVKSSDEWLDACNESYNAASALPLKEFRKIVDGLFHSPFKSTSDLSSSYHRKSYHRKSYLDVCIAEGFTSSEMLRLADRKMWLAMGGQKTPEFFQSVRIMLKLEPLPDDFDPIESSIPLGVKHLAELGIYPPKSQM